MTRTVHHTFAKRASRGPVKFGSKTEARYYDELLARQAAGEVLFHLRQAPLDLGGGVTYRVDFVEFLADGRVRFVDVKSKGAPLTREHALKSRLVSDRYPFDIEIERR